MPESWAERVARAAMYRGNEIPNLKDVKPGIYPVAGILITYLEHGYGGAEKRVTVHFADGTTAQTCTMSGVADAENILRLLYPDDETGSGFMFEEPIDFRFDLKETKNGPVPTFQVHIPSEEE